MVFTCDYLRDDIVSLQVYVIPFCWLNECKCEVSECLGIIAMLMEWMISNLWGT